MNKIKNLFIFLCFLFCGAGCAYLGYLRDPFMDIPNFYQVDEFLYRGGQPSEEGLRKLKDKGIRTIINLQDESEELIRERGLATRLKMDFVNIPLSVYRRPTDEEAMEFLNIVTDKKRQPVFVHCDSGRDRTGAFVAMYRVVVNRWTIRQAYKEAKSLGFWPYHGGAELKKFIHQLKDKEDYFKKVGRPPP